MHTKTIQYDRHTKDFAMFFNGELVGYAASYLQAETTLNKLVYETLARQSTASISDLTPEDALVMLDLKAEEAQTSAAEPAHTDADYSPLEPDFDCYAAELAAQFPVIPRPIWIHTPQEAAFAAACAKRRKAAA